MKHELKKLASEPSNFHYARYSLNLDTYDFSHPLTRENYKEKYHQLLCLEEQERASQLKERYSVLALQWSGSCGFHCNLSQNLT